MDDNRVEDRITIEAECDCYVTAHYRTNNPECPVHRDPPSHVPHSPPSMREPEPNRTETETSDHAATLTRLLDPAASGDRVGGSIDVRVGNTVTDADGFDLSPFGNPTAPTSMDPDRPAVYAAEEEWSQDVLDNDPTETTMIPRDNVDAYLRRVYAAAALPENMEPPPVVFDLPWDGNDLGGLYSQREP